MDLMKNMYETGDDEMKRTIAKAWSEGQKKGTQDLKNFESDL
jgi:calcyclin binding protein